MNKTHTLSVRRRNSDTPYYDGACSCGKWRVVNRLIDDVRRSHDAHKQDLLGPDAQDAREAANAAQTK